MLELFWQPRRSDSDRHWWMGTWLPGFRSGLDFLPVPNHGFRWCWEISSVQSLWYWSPRSEKSNLSDTVNKGSQSCGLNTFWIIVPSCCCLQEGTQWNVSAVETVLWNVNNIVAPTHHPGFCHFPSSENTHLILSTLWAIPSPLPTASSHIGFNMQVLICLPSWQECLRPLQSCSVSRVRRQDSGLWVCCDREWQSGQ